MSFAFLRAMGRLMRSRKVKSEAAMKDELAQTVARLKAKAEERQAHGKEKALLWELLDQWATMDESLYTQSAVDVLRQAIMACFRQFPEAEGWYAEWRRLHPEARLA